MTVDEIKAWLAANDSMVISDNGQFALVHPSGVYGGGHRAQDLAATTREAALAEAWAFMNPDALTLERVEVIKHVVAEDFGTSPLAFLRHDRAEPLATARRIAMALCCITTTASRELLRKAFNRDAAATVTHAFQSVQDQAATDPEFSARVARLHAAARAAFTKELAK